MSELPEPASVSDGAAEAPYPRAGTRDRRANARQKVREIRNRLAHAPSRKPDFEYDLLCMFARKELSARVALPLLATIFSLASTFWAPVLHAAAWLATVIAMKLVVIAACRRLLSRPRLEVDVAFWRRRLIWLELANGIAWAGIAAVGVGTADATGHVFMLACLIVLLAIRMTFASAVMTVLCAGTIPITRRWSPVSWRRGIPSISPWPPLPSACTSISSSWLGASTPRRWPCWSSAPRRMP